MKNLIPNKALFAVVAALLALGCGRLSKSDAKAMLQAKFNDKDDNTYCRASGVFVSDEGPRTGLMQGLYYAFIDADKNVSCINELDAAGIVKIGGCIEGPSCYKRNFHLGGPAVDVSPKDDNIYALEVRFPCGKKRLADVTSISTDGKKATVKYTVDSTRDEALMKKVTDCALLGGKAGTEDRISEFTRDDDGKWSLVE